MGQREEAVIRQETEKMEEFRRFLEKAIAVHEADKARTDAQVSLMLKQYDNDNVELFDQISVALSMQELYGQNLKGYRKALAAPFFARIDFEEDGLAKAALYIGKNGVNDTENGEALIVDWRAPVANLYYNSEMGRASYLCLEGEIFGELSLKRTFTLEDGRIVDYYDSDLITNDTLLQEYLAKNSDVVLKDIVATIQKDQNEIIRIDPWVNVIVQGVAGSGKTTVAMHRISYILYTYPERYRPEQIVIIGASRMFLSYVAGMLPELGVESITQAVLPQFLLELAARENGKMQYMPYLEQALDSGKEGADPEPLGEALAWKSSLAFCRELERFLDRFTRRAFPLQDVDFLNQRILTGEEVIRYGRDGVAKTLLGKRDVLKNLLATRVKRVLPNMVEEDELERQGYYGLPMDENGNIPKQRLEIAKRVKEMARKVKNTFDKPFKGLSGKKLYEMFLTELAQEKGQGAGSRAAALSLPQCQKGRYDLYDLCGVLYLTTRLTEVKKLKEYRHLVVDEAQDFGLSVYRLLEWCLPSASFTIMGDTSQNIAEYTGLDDWRGVEEQVFGERMLDFRALSKSYRNTIEIAQVANTVLQNLNRVPGAEPRVYDIDPVVRHGAPVKFLECVSFREMVWEIGESLKRFAEENYKTTAIIAKTPAQCKALHKALEKAGIAAKLVQNAQDPYEGGVTVFPILHVKGMEFDSVILAGAGEEDYALTKRDVKLLYVAATRGLHELHVYSVGKLSPLFGQTH